jgi:PAS domain S-box-containing protein
METEEGPETSAVKWGTFVLPNYPNESFLAAIIESSDDAILSKNLDGIITSWNRGAQKIYGYSPEEVIGHHVSMLVPPESPDEIPQIMARLRKGEHIEHYETIRQMNVSVTISPLRDASGEIIGASAIARDITEQKRSNDLTSFLAAIVDSSDDAIISKSLDGIILSWNKGAERLYGYSAEEAIGQPIAILSPPDLPDEIPAMMVQIKKGKVVEHFETVRKRKDGTLVDIWLAISPIKDSNGEIIAASAAARDISARKRIEQEKSRLFEELTQSLNEKNVLLQEVYHRVKNNLQVISSLLELRARYIKDPLQAAAFKESVARIRAMSLVHERLYKTKGLDRIELSSYLRSLMEQLIQTYTADKTIGVKVTGDHLDIGLDIAVPLGLISNELITNSIKHAFDGQDTGEIRVDVKTEDGTAVIRITDTGVGLPESIDFQKSETFGFRIVKLIIRQLKGTVDVVRNDGTSFVIKFPLDRSSE